MKIMKSINKILVFSVVLSVLPGCAYFEKFTKKRQKTDQKTTQKTQSKTVPKSAVSKPVDTQAQQRYYDLGLKYYSEENYAEAKKAWQHVLQLGTHTPLSDKAREYLKKTEQVLKTLHEMEKK